MKQINETRNIPGVIITLIFLSLFIFLPFGGIAVQAFAGGIEKFFAALNQRDTASAFWLTVSVTLASLPITVIFGIAAAWLLTKFRFPGRNFILSLLNIPLSISPVIVGLLFIVFIGQNSPLGGFLESNGIKVIFAWPGLLLVTLFISFPYVVRELIPVLEASGNDDEEAAITLGASGAATFFRVILPKIRLALFYGITLSAARAVGEYGASAVVSGLLRGRTVTLPIQVQIFYNEYMTAAAFASATIFIFFGILTIITKRGLELRMRAAAKLEAAQGETA